MRKRRLGTTGLDVSEVGFGAWGIAGTMWLGGRDEDARDAILAAREAGVDFFDTALAYGDGISEKMLSAALGADARTGRVTIATKIPPKNRLWPARADSRIADAFPPAHMRECVVASLGFLGLDALPLQQFHVWHDAWLDDPTWPETRREMEKLREEGKVRHWGISINSHDPESAIRTLEDPLFETAQFIFNIYDRSPERGLFELAARRGLGLINRVPFDEGALTGAVDAGVTFPRGDWRERYFRGGRKDEAAQHAKALKPLLGSEAATLPELALRFCLTRPEISTVIPGARRAAHARANAAVSDGRSLSPALLEKLKAHAWEKNWYA
jgi:aryl-alcohol dehydrogenase-like predicted oxidoreductase